MFVRHPALRHFQNEIVRSIELLRPFDPGNHLLRVANQDQVAPIEILISNAAKDLGYPALVRSERF